MIGSSVSCQLYLELFQDCFKFEVLSCISNFVVPKTKLMHKIYYSKKFPRRFSEVDATFWQVLMRLSSITFSDIS